MATKNRTTWIPEGEELLREAPTHGADPNEADGGKVVESFDPATQKTFVRWFDKDGKQLNIVESNHTGTFKYQEWQIRFAGQSTEGKKETRRFQKLAKLRNTAGITLEERNTYNDGRREMNGVQFTTLLLHEFELVPDLVRELA